MEERNGYSGLIRSAAGHNTVKCSTEQADVLALYVQMLEKWNKSINLIAENDLFNVIDRHIMDSIVQFNKIKGTHKNIADIGSGNGFPGIVIAVFHPECHVALIEKRAKRASFLKEATYRMGLNNTYVFDKDAGLFDYSKTDIVTSRAVGDIDRLRKMLGKVYGGTIAVYESEGICLYEA